MREDNKADRRPAARTNGRRPSFDAGRQRVQQTIPEERAPIARKPKSEPLELRADEDKCVREITAGHAIVEVLKAEGVRAIYGIPGGHVLPIYDGLYDAPEIRHFLVRHEQAAASMAAAYAQLTGETAVCLVTAGPGATNLATNVAEAFVGAVPMVILAGRGATGTTYRGASQEVDTDQLFRPISNGPIGSIALT